MRRGAVLRGVDSRSLVTPATVDYRAPGRMTAVIPEPSAAVYAVHLEGGPP
jgi:hypothetical protein